jgi:hypothetical protein
MMDAVVASSKRDVERIRARGGDMVWVRPPSDGPVLANERLRVPRDQVWDRLLRETHCFGVYFEDYPEMRGLEVPEWPHLSRQIRDEIHYRLCYGVEQPRRAAKQE